MPVVKLGAADRAADYARREAKAVLRFRKESFLRTVAEIARLDPELAIVETVAQVCAL